MSAPSRSGAEAVDWAAIRRRVEEAGARLHGGATDPAAVRALLEARARVLARTQAVDAGEAGTEVLPFERGGARYAVESRWVWAVFRPAVVSALPGQAAPVVGVAAWRGELLVLLDVGSAPRSAAAPGFVVVLGDAGPSVGVVAESVGALERIPASRLTAPEGEPVQGRRREAVMGITPDAVTVLDGGRLIRINK